MRKCKRIAAIIFIFAILFTGTIPAKAAETQSKVIRVACGMNDALYLDENGEPAGICLQYLRQLAWNENWTIEYVEGSFLESIQNLYDGKIDLMFPVGKADDTEGKLLYSEFIGGYQQIGLFAKADAEIYYEDYAYFDNTKVGLSLGANNDILEEYAKEHDFSYTPVSLNTVQDKIDALMSGEVDLVAFSTLNTVPDGKLVAILDQVPFYFCTSVDKPELLQEINESMSLSMVNTPDVVSEMYQDVLTGNNIVSFTREETEKIKSMDTVVFGVYNDCLPLAGINSKGECVGIYVDIIEKIGEISGLNVEVKPIPDSNKLYSYMDDGTVDFVIGALGLRFYSENAENYLASNKITEYTTVAVTKPDYQFEENESPTIALIRSRNYLEEYIYGRFPEATIQYFDNRKECLEAVRTGAVDATFLNTWEYNYEIKNPRFRDMMEWESIRITSMINLGGTRTSDLELLSILEKTISQITPEEIADIVANNLNMPYDSYDFTDRLYGIKDELTIGIVIFLIVLACLIIYLQVKRKYIKDLVVANSAKSDFLSRMSHELRTPLNAINGYASLTRDGVQKKDLSKENVLANMESIQSASDYLLGIIKDILDVQRMRTGKITINKSVIEPTEYMKTIVKMIQPMADEKQIDFTYTMLGGKEDKYLLDALRVQQLLFNLLNNAVKFTPDGGKIEMTSDILAKDEKYATIQFVITDNGIGMSQEFLQEKLFHKFAQENQDITSPYAGCGNGLAICKELVELMDGSIVCESEKGKGTKFTVLIRVERFAKEDKGIEKSATKPKYDLTGIKVLMCEDNPMNQAMEKRLLERMNCIVEIADDGQIGLDKFKASKENEYDIVLMDIRMPNMDGLQATKAIRALPRQDAASIPILAVSANAFEEDVQKSLAAGMNEHLAKPVDIRIFYEKIKQYCNP